MPRRPRHNPSSTPKPHIVQHIGVIPHKHPWWWPLIICLVVILILLLRSWLVLWMGSWFTPSLTPRHHLKGFIDHQMQRHDLVDINELKVDDITQFAGATCIHASTFEQAQEALLKQLRGVPENVGHDVVDSALVRGVSLQNSLQNTSAPLQVHGKASTYLSWWSTQYTANTGEYHTCVMVTGVSFLAAEVEAGRITEKTQKVIATEPCHCNLLWCESCPVIKEIESSRPVFKRHVLTLQQHSQLHAYMIDRGIDLAKKLIHQQQVQGERLQELELPAPNDTPNLGGVLEGWDMVKIE